VKRLSITPRPHWQDEVERLGLTYHTPAGQPYWDESACYEFTAREIDELEKATEELQRLCLAAAQFILDRDRFDDLAIPSAARQMIRETWNSEPPSLYGRFDLAYDGTGPPKLLEYNADTPTSLLEASVIQWYWRRDVYPATDQFNSIHEKLIAKWSELKTYLRSSTLHFTCMPDEEDLMTITYLRDTAQQAGIKTEQLFVREIGWNQGTKEFRDLEEHAITSLFALYPWEWLLKDFAAPILSTYSNRDYSNRDCSNMDWIEPIWKMLWSNKGLLAVLWELFPQHPNLLPAFLDSPRQMTDFVRKPLLSREGANITVHRQGLETSTPGPYGEGPFVYQAFAPARAFDGQTPTLGSWYITDQGPAGIGIREAPMITSNLSRFVPHYFL